MKYINKIGMMAVAGFALATTSCSDYSDYNSVPESSNAQATQTLYENIKSRSDLKNFAALIDAAGMAEELNASQYYTMWAPVDGSYDYQSILNMGQEKIAERFVKQHIAQYSYPVSGEFAQSIITLNDKHHDFTNVSFDDFKIVNANIPSTNGLIHTINGYSVFYNSIYGNLPETQGCNNLVKFIKDYDEKYIDKRNSVPGPMVNGQQTYLDTVWLTTNPVVKRILRADIEDEDSSYVMLMPTDEAWQTAYDTIKSSYKYITNFKYMDVAGISGIKESDVAAGDLTKSIAPSQKALAINDEIYNDSLPKYWITRNLVYSLSNPNNMPLLTNQPIHGSGDVVRDTLYATTNSKISNVEELISHLGEPQKMSNGYTRTLDTLVFKSYETYQPVLSTIQPIRTLGLNKRPTHHTMLQSTMIRNYGEDILSELPDFLKRRVMSKKSNYVTWVATDEANYATNSARPEMDFAITNALSTKYRIFVIFCPISHTAEGNPYLKKDKPYYARFDIAYNKADGSVDYYRLNPGKTSKDEIIIPADGKFHYVEMSFEFPITYYGIEAFPTFFISNDKKFSTSSNRSKYEQELRIQNIYFVPEEALDHFKNDVY